MNVAEKLIEKGWQEGRQDEKLKTARKMLEKGIQIDDVVEVTELSKNELSKLH